MRSSTLAMLLAVLLAGSARVDSARIADAAELRFADGDRVVFLGNTFAERLTHFGYLETLISARLSNLRLTFRNLGWSGDTPSLQPRPKNFGNVHQHLGEQEADVIFLCFGMNEAFEGAEGLPKFQYDLTRFIESLAEHRYNGKSAPRLVLVSPIPHERLSSDLPDPTEHNRHLATYTAAMRSIAETRAILFLDLFTPLQRLIEDDEADQLTFNGIHLTQYGYWVAAHVMVEQLGLATDAGFSDLSATATSLPQAALPSPPPPAGARVHAALKKYLPRLVVKDLAPATYTLNIDGSEVATADHTAWAAGVDVSAAPAYQAVERLRLAIREKNETFFTRWRAVNSFYIVGDRAKPFGVKSFPPELRKLDEITAKQDEAIWRLARPLPTQTVELDVTGT